MKQKMGTVLQPIYAVSLQVHLSGPYCKIRTGTAQTTNQNSPFHLGSVFLHKKDFYLCFILYTRTPSMQFCNWDLASRPNPFASIKKETGLLFCSSQELRDSCLFKLLLSCETIVETLYENRQVS